MIAPRVGGALRAAVVVRRSVPCHLRGGGSVAVCRALRGAPPTPPPTLLRSLGESLSLSPHSLRPRKAGGAVRQMLAATTPPKPRRLQARASEDLGEEGGIGKAAVRGFGRNGRICPGSLTRFWVFALRIGRARSEVLDNIFRGSGEKISSRTEVFWAYLDYMSFRGTWSNFWSTLRAI